MNKDMKKKYDLIAKISGVVIGLVLVLGISYAVFKTTTMADKDNIVNAGKLDVRVENEKDEITMDNAMPQTEKQGKSNTPYTFDIVNEGTIDAMYDLYIELSDDTTLKDNDIRYYLTKTVDGEETPIDEEASHYLSDALDTEKKEKKLYRIDINDELKTKDKVSYKLYLWIDYDATKEDAANKTFSANIRVDASQLVKRNETLLRKVDVSENSDGSAYAYVYEDGTLKIKGTGNIASGIDDMDIYATNSTKVLNNYKKVLTSMGYDVSDITTIEELQTFKEEQSTSDSSFDDNFNQQCVVIEYKEILEEMGYENTDTITDSNTLMTYMQNKGLMDSDGNFTTEGETVQTKAETKYNNAYSDTVSITDIEISEGITNIPKGLYTGNTIIKSVSIPSSVKIIEKNAFAMCSSLETVSFKEDSQLVNMGNNTFSLCKSLKNINIPSTITKIGSGTFEFCKSLTNITIPNSVTSIGSHAFNNAGLTSLEIPSNVTFIDNSAFTYCTGLTSVTIPNTVTSMDGYVFDNCTSLKSISFEENSKITSISGGMFYNCTSLESITLPDSITSISGDKVFYNCTSLKSITIPSNITSLEIASGAFTSCTSLSKINYTGTIDEWISINFKDEKSNPLYYANNLYINDELVEDVTIDKNVKQYAFSDCKSLKSVTLTDNVTSIGTYAFYKCTSLESVTISSSVTTIEKIAFAVCTGLTKTNYTGTLDEWLDIDFNRGSNPIQYSKNLYINNELVENITIDKDIKQYAFYNLQSLKSVTLTNNVTSIGSDAFYGCTGMTNITIPNSVTYIGASTFYGWTSSQTIDIDNTESYATSNFSSSWKSKCSATINYLRT